MIKFKYFLYYRTQGSYLPKQRILIPNNKNFKEYPHIKTGIIVKPE